MIQEVKTAGQSRVEQIVLLKCMRCGKDVHPDKIWNTLTIGDEGNVHRKLCVDCFDIDDAEESEA